MASNITVKVFLDLFEEFKKRPRATLEVYIGIASGRTPATVWGSNTSYATALLAAHLLSTTGKQGGGDSGGAVTQEQVGDLSRSYQYIGEIGSGDAGLMTTRYGIEYVNLRNETIIPIMGTGRASPRRC